MPKPHPKIAPTPPPPQPPGTSPLQRPASLKAFGALLRQQRQTLGLTLDTLMDKTAISKPYLSNIETGRTPGPASEPKLRRIAKALHLDPTAVLAGADWLRAPASVRRLVGSGQWPVASGQSPEQNPSIKNEQSKIKNPLPRHPDGTIDLDAVMAHGAKPAADQPTIENRKSKIENSLPLRSIPLINRVAAGKAAEYTDLDYPAGFADQYLPMPDLPDAPMAAAFALTVIGDSMSPEYPEGEIIVVGPAQNLPALSAPAAPDNPNEIETRNSKIENPLPPPQDCVVRLGEHDNFATTFKRVFFDRAGETISLRLVPLNAKHPTRSVLLEHVTGIYPVLYRVTKPRPPDTHAALLSNEVK